MKVSEATLKALRAGKEIHELRFEAIAEIAAAAADMTLDELDDDALRKQIIRCVSGPHVNALLPAHAGALWGCVLSWDPPVDELERQSLDILAWACRYFGKFPEARPMASHSTHNIPVPASLRLGRHSALTFEHTPQTLLGEGATSAVYKARLEGHEDIAVKISRLTDHGILRSMLLEYLMLRRAGDIEGVLTLHGAGYYEVGDEAYMLIVEELGDTTLDDVFIKRKAAGEPFTEREVRDTLVKPLLNALRDLHGHSILHRDIKPKNIHYVGGRYKLGDFETATYVHDPSLSLETGTFAGSPAFSTAAALKGHYGPHTDINALACIAHMMLRGDLPAMEDAPGTSTLVRGIRGGAPLTEDDMLRQEKARAAVNDWLLLRKQSVTQMLESAYSTPFERFFVAPILTQGLYTEASPGAITTADDALECLARIELAEETRDTCDRAMVMAGEGRRDEARRLLESLDQKLRRPSSRMTELTMHVMIQDTLNRLRS